MIGRPLVGWRLCEWPSPIRAHAQPFLFYRPASDMVVSTGAESIVIPPALSYRQATGGEPFGSKNRLAAKALSPETDGQGRRIEHLAQFVSRGPQFDRAGQYSTQ